jgi:hypothetical protein
MRSRTQRRTLTPTPQKRRGRRWEQALTPEGEGDLAQKTIGALGRN